MLQAERVTSSILQRSAAVAAALAPFKKMNGPMKMRANILFAGVIALFASSLGSAQTIYSNTFSGGATNINQAAPTLATDTAGAASTAIWRDAGNLTMLYANGSVNSLVGDSALLPFTPQNGYVYTLTASVTFTGAVSSWVGAGFAEYYAYTGTATSRMNDSGVTGFNWAILTESSGNVQWFAGPSTSNTAAPSTNAFFTAGAGTHTLVLTLNTTGAAWTISCAVDGKVDGSTYTYTTQPVITAFGLTQNTITADSTVHWNSISLTAAGSAAPTPATAAVSFTTPGVPLNPSFVGLSYEKADLLSSEGLFTSANTPLVNLFGLLTPAVLRIGGGSSDLLAWNGVTTSTSPETTFTPAEVDSFTGFMKALPSGWSTIYGINLEYNTPANAALEATYAQSDLGSKLLGFEIGNEPEAYWSYSTFLPNWQAEESAIVAAAPGWDKGTGKGGYIVEGPDQGSSTMPNLTGFTDAFAGSETASGVPGENGVASLLSQHYYVGATGTMNSVLAYPNPTLNFLVSNIAGTSGAAGNEALGSRITEAGSISGGGVLGVSNAFGSALWALDFMLTAAGAGVNGVNFHGGDLSPYSPINNSGANITSIGPEFYAMKMFQLIPSGGSVVPTTVTLTPSTANFSAYGVQASNGTVTAVLNNKEVNYTVSVTLNLGANVSSVGLISLTAPNLFDNTGFLLGGAPITTTGTWGGGVQQVLTPTNGQLTVSVPPTTAILLIPTVAPPPAAAPTFSLAAGLYNAVQSVTLADATPGEVIYYTTDGSTPTTSSTLYTGPISVGVTETVNAIATATGFAASPVASIVYTIKLLPVAAAPTFSIAMGTYVTVQTVSLSDSVSGAAIYYTTNGSTPTTSSTLYSGPITVGVTETINAIATASGYTASPAASGAYVINLPAPGFTITAAPNTTITVAPHGSGSSTLTIVANAAFNGTISFSCSWYIPAGTDCQFAPATVTVNAFGTASTTVSLTLPPAGYTALSSKPGPWPPATMLAGVLCLVGLRKRRRLRMVLLFAISAVGMSMFSGCTSASSTPPSPSQFFVNGAGSSLPVNSPVGATPTAVPESLQMVFTVQ